jgi:hypothetical protein
MLSKHVAKCSNGFRLKLLTACSTAELAPLQMNHREGSAGFEPALGGSEPLDFALDHNKAEAFDSKLKLISRIG